MCRGWTCAALIGMALANLAHADCPRGAMKKGGKCYWASDTERTFESCQRDECGPHGGTLAVIKRENYKDIMIGLGIGDKDRVAIWIGYTRARAAVNSSGIRKWGWTTGERTGWEHWGPSGLDKFCGEEDCAAIAGGGGNWMAASCRLRLPCLCVSPGKVAPGYNLTVPGFRDDTCYEDCGDVTKWCNAWPFLRLYDVNEDVCHWESTDGQKRGRGTNECARMVSEDPTCGKYFSYALGRCKCNPATGIHRNCSARETDPQFDVFRNTDAGPQLAFARQRCVYSTNIEEEYFQTMNPVKTWDKLFEYWFGAALIWIIFGAACAVGLFTLSAGCCDRSPVPWNAGKQKVQYAGIEGAYGPLLDPALPGDNEDVTGEVVNRWVLRAGVGIVVYGLGLLSVGATLAAHMSGNSPGFGLEVLEELIMTASMFAVTRAAFMVHLRLSPMARTVAGNWVLVTACATAGMCICSLCGVIVFCTLADYDFDNVCFATYLFRWSMLVTLPLQCIGGVAISRVQICAERASGQNSLVSGWVWVVVRGFYVSGWSMWFAGYLDCVHEASYLVALFFVFAAAGHVASGVALMKANRAIKEYFSKAAGQRAEDAKQIGIGKGSYTAADLSTPAGPSVTSNNFGMESTGATA